MKQVEESVSGLLSFLVLESSPLANLPGAKLFMPNREKQATELRDWREGIYQGMLDDYLRRRAQNATGDCIIGSIIDRREETGMTDSMVSLTEYTFRRLLNLFPHGKLLGLFSGIIGGGYETVALSLSW
jgi:hypothetical protein